MKIQVLIGLLKSGKKPMVRLTGELWDESFGQKGMIAKVMSFVEQNDDTVSLDFYYNEHRDHNLNLDEPSWFIGNTGKTGTAIESDHFDDPNNLHEDVNFGEDDDIAVELVDDHTPLALYMASGTKEPYVEWLEAKLEELAPDCMKDWKPTI